MGKSLRNTDDGLPIFGSDSGSSDTSTAEGLPILKKKIGTPEPQTASLTGGTPIFSQFPSSSDRPSGFATAGGNTKPTTTTLPPVETPSRVPDPSFSNMLSQSNALDNDIAANSTISLSAYNNAPKDASSLQGFNQSQQSLASGSLVPSFSETATSKAAQIKNDPDALKEYRKTRFSDLDKQIKELEATKQPTVGYLETGQRISQEPQPVDNEINDLKNYKAQLQKSVADAALISVPKQVISSNKNFSIEDVGKKYLETIGDPIVSDDEKVLNTPYDKTNPKGDTNFGQLGQAISGNDELATDKKAYDLSSEAIRNKFFRQGATALSAYHVKAATDLSDSPIIKDYNNALVSSKQIGKSSEEGLYPKADPKKYETKLPDTEEPKFQAWLDKYHSEGKIPDGDYKFYKENGYGYDYDFRAAYLAGVKPEIYKGDGKWHWNDTGKKPNEPTFSDQSKYNGVDGLIGGSWDGDNFIRPTAKINATIAELKNNPDVIDYADNAAKAIHYDNEAKNSSKYYPQVARQELRQTLNDKFFDIVSQKDEKNNFLNPLTPLKLATKAILGETPTEADIAQLAKETGKPIEEVKNIVNTPVSGMFATAPEGVRVSGMASGVSQAVDETLTSSLNGLRRIFNVNNVDAKNALLQTKSDAYNMGASQNSLYDKQGQLNFNPYSVANMSGRGIGQMAIYAAPSMLTGGLAEGLLAPEIAAAAKGANMPLWAAAVNKSVPALTTIASGYVGSYEPAYKEISAYTNDEDTRRGYSNFIALANAVPELFLSPAEIAEKVGIGKPTKEALIKSFIKDADKLGIEAAFTARIAKGAGTALETVGAENIEELATNIATNKADEQYMGKVRTAKELADQFIQTVVSTTVNMLPMAIGGGVSGYHDAGGSRREALFEAGNNPEETKAGLQSHLDNGVINQDQFNMRSSIVNQMQNIVANLPKENVHGEPLTYEQKTKLAAAQYRIDLNKKLGEKSKNEGGLAAQEDLIKEDTNAAVEEQKKILTLYHGSGQNFDKFSSDKIGTGEKSQSFGHGLYFTDVKEIAADYAERGKSSTGEANVYEVSLHDGKSPEQYDWVRWDAPISETQKEKLSKLDKSSFERPYYYSKAIEAKNGEQMYEMLSLGLGSDQKASKALLDAGIDGIKFPVGSNFDKGHKGHNYVVFDDRAITIKNKTSSKENADQGGNRIGVDKNGTDITTEDLDNLNKQLGEMLSPSDIEDKYAVSPKDAINIFNAWSGTKPKVQEGSKKVVIQTSKPISQMTSDELYDHSNEVKRELAKKDKEFAGKTEQEKIDGGYYDIVDNVSDLRDTAQRVNFVENSENLDELANSTKSALRNFDKNNPSEDSLAILNAARIKAAELNIAPEDLLKEVIKKVGNDYVDKEDAELMMRDVLEKVMPSDNVPQPSSVKQLGNGENKAGETPTPSTESQAVTGIERPSSQETPAEIPTDNKAPIDDIQAKKDSIEKRRQDELKTTDVDYIKTVIGKKKFKDGNTVDKLFPQFNVDNANTLLETFKSTLSNEEVDLLQKYKHPEEYRKKINEKYDAELADLNKSKINESQNKSTEVLLPKGNEGANVNNESVPSKEESTTAANASENKQGAKQEIDTPVKNEYKARIDNLDKESKQSDVSQLKEGDYVNVPRSEKSSGVTGFVKKVGRTNVVLDTFYQLGSSADDGIMQEISVKKADIKEFIKPKDKQNSITSNTTENASNSSQVPEQKMPEQSSQREHARTSQEQNTEKPQTNGSDSSVGSEGVKPKKKVSRTKLGDALYSAADRIENGVLPSWAKSSTLPEGTQRQGVGDKELGAFIAKTLRATGDAINKGAELADAVSKGVKDLLDYYKSNNVPVDEDALRKGFEQEVKNNIKAARQKQQEEEAKKKVNKAKARNYAAFTVRMAELLNTDKNITPEQIIKTLGRVTEEQKKIIYDQYEKRRSKEESGLAATKKWVGELFDDLANGKNISKSAFNIAKSDYAHVLDLVADKFIEYKVISNRKLEKFADKAIELFKDDYVGAIDYVSKADKLGEAKPILLAKLAVKLDEAGKGKEAAKVMENLIATSTFTARTLQSFQRVNEILNVKGSPQYKTELAKKIMDKAKEMSDARVQEVENDFRRQLGDNEVEIQKYKDKLDSIREKAHKSTLSSIREKMENLVNSICNTRRK